MKNSLNKKGLSLTQAQSISNLINQRATDINAQLSRINNCEKSFKLNGEKYVTVAGVKMDSLDIKNILLEKAFLHAVQSFLMENIKAKEAILNDIKNEKFVSKLKPVEFPTLETANIKPLVDESWGWEQLSLSEINEFYEANAMAAHIGQFIHKHGKLDSLRTELSKLNPTEFTSIKKDELIPLKVDIHYTQEELFSLHTDLSDLHREYEQKVNYFKAKVKNLVSTENAKIERDNSLELSRVEEINSKLREDYNFECKKYASLLGVETKEFESERHNRLKEASTLRIQIDERFKTIIDKYDKDTKDIEGA